MTKPGLIQLCPLSPLLEVGLHDAFDVCALYAEADPDGWLALHGADVVAIATGGHIGAPNALIDKLPHLGIIAINGVGYDKVDLVLARQRGVRVTTTPGVLSEDVADLAVGLIISLLRGLPQSDAFVRQGAWVTGERPLMRKVSGRTFGIMGLGEIGSALASRLAAFGTVIYHGRHEKLVPYRYVADLTSLAQDADVLILCAAATAETMDCIDADVLDALGPDGWLINVSRGSLVKEADLIAALQAGRIAGAGLDVFADEPRAPEALFELGNVVLTPHIASATVETCRAMAETVLANLKAFIAGQPLRSALV